MVELAHMYCVHMEDTVATFVSEICSKYCVYVGSCAYVIDTEIETDCFVAFYPTDETFLKLHCAVFWISSD